MGRSFRRGIRHGRRGATGGVGGILPQKVTLDLTKSYAITNTSGTRFYQTQAGGGEAGHPAGFGVLYLLAIDSVSSANRRPGGRQEAGTGWLTSIVGAAPAVQLYATMRNQAGVTTDVGGQYLFPTDINNVCVYIIQHTGTTLQNILNSVQRIVELPIDGYTPASAATVEQFGNLAGFPLQNVSEFGRLSWRGVASPSSLEALMNAIRALGDIPTKVVVEQLMPSVTCTHRNSVRDTLLKQTNVDGQIAPAIIPDTASFVPTDDFIRQSTPVIKVFDLSDKLKIIGVRGYSASSYWQSDVVYGDSFDITVDLAVERLLLTNRHILSNVDASGTKGFSLWIPDYGTPGFSITFWGGSSPGVLSYTATPDTYSLNSVQSLRMTYSTAGGFRLYQNGVSIGRSINVYVPSDVPFRVGSSALASAGGSDNVSIFRLRCGQFGGPVEHDWDFNRDIVENGGFAAGVPATIQNRAGASGTLSRVGTGLRPSYRFDDMSWAYETSPIIEGATFDGDALNHLVTSQTFDIGLNSAPWWLAFTVRFNGKSVTSSTRRLLGTLNLGGTSGFVVQTTGANASLQASLFQVNGSALSPVTTIITASDVHRIFPGVIAWDGTRFRLYARRQEMGTGSSTATAAISDPPGPLYFGRTTLGVAGADGVSMFEVACGHGQIVLADVQMLTDSIIANDGKILGIPGKTDHRWRFGVGGAVPASISDEMLSAVSVNRQGSLAVAQQTVRSFPL